MDREIRTLTIWCLKPASLPVGLYPIISRWRETWTPRAVKQQIYSLPRYQLRYTHRLRASSRNWTDNLMLTRHLLYQLSYWGLAYALIWRWISISAYFSTIYSIKYITPRVRNGIWTHTTCLEDRYANHWHYTHRWQIRDSNPYYSLERTVTWPV